VAVRSTRICVPDHELADLRRRLAETRWPTPMADYGWDEGTDAAYLRDFIAFWGGPYNWRDREAELNRFDHQLAEIDGAAIHFIYAEAKSAHAVPLLLLHGWPSSFVQMTEFIPLLTQPRADGAPAFHVVAASLPGYPLTRLPEQPGMSFARIAELMTRLMVEELGFTRFVGRGSDQGALVLQQIGLTHPEHLIGLHRSGITPFASSPIAELSEEEQAYQKRVATWALEETAYAQLQALRPETLTPALCDSPVALASWFLEKFQRWGDCRVGPDAQFGRERLADNLSLHWFTRSAAAATRLYLEGRRDPGMLGRVSVPTAILMPLHDGVTVPAPRAWCERSYNVVRYNVLTDGGHFPEWEVPHAVADDLRAFAHDLEDRP
jgi:pimeloyl-ACP methyl ester carboxylesterase